MAHTCLLYLGLKKKISSLGKQKGFEIIGLWKRSINNHVYWIASSTPDGNPDIMKAKWRSLLNHLHNIHTDHSEKFPHCLHDPIPEDDDRDWFQPGKLINILNGIKFVDHILCSDIWNVMNFEAVTSLNFLCYTLYNITHFCKLILK